MISRVTRSASALTVSSMTRFWSSVNRGHLASSVRGESLDAGQRGAQLVGDGGDQVGAAALEPGPLLGAAQRDHDAADGAGSRCQSSRGPRRGLRT